MKKLFIIVPTVFIGLVILVSCNTLSPRNAAVVYALDAGRMEEFSARELQRYFYLRTGILADLIRSDSAPAGYDECFIVGNRNRRLIRSLDDAAGIGRYAEILGTDGFLIKTCPAPQGNLHVIAGGEGTGTLYGTYRLLEHTGMRFNLDGDVVPDSRFDPDLLSVDEIGTPRFDRRGLQPFHDFNVGPDWWNLTDYHSVLSQMAKLRLNFIGFHTYPSWNRSAGPEANVWIGLPESVDPDGDVKTGYEAGVVTTRRGWEVRPFPTGKYASGAGLLFEADEYGPDFMLEYLEWPVNQVDATTLFNRYGDFQQKVFEHAKSLGIRTASGTELPLGIPDLLAGQLKEQGLDPEDPEVIQRLYEGIFLRLMRKTPVDYVWFWMPEIWLWSKPGCPGWEITTEENARRDIRLIQSAARSTGIASRFATSGWRLGTVDNSRWTDENTPKDWAMSSINTSAGGDPVEKLYGENLGRPRWVIGWAEDDGTAGAHCCTTWDVQFWVERMLANSSDAFRYGVDGMMAIHWRTSSIAPNLSALSEAGWYIRKPESFNLPDPGVDLNSGLFWEDWGRSRFGGEAGARAGLVLKEFDGRHPQLNHLVDNGYKTTDQEILDLFAPLEKLRTLGSEIRGTGNKSRFKYWYDYLDASRLRATTWVLASRLDSLVARSASLPDADERRRFVRERVLPARIGLARSWEEMIAAYLRCARSTGEVGTITSIESGNRDRILLRRDSLLSRYLGEPLPPEAFVRTDYQGAPRIFVSSVSTRWKEGEPLEIRPFVLSRERCREVTLHWRPLGTGSFRQAAAGHRARNAFRVTLPGNPGGCVEYYLEARLDGGKKIRYPETAPALNSTVIFWNE